MSKNAHPFGLWDPWQPEDVARFFSTAGVPWWIAGGWAIDLFLGEQTRAHEDIDVQILRRDQLNVRALFQEWDIQGALSGGPDIWPFWEWEPGQLLPPSIHDVWCRPSKTDPWVLQLMIGDTDDGQWLFRRDARLRRPLATIGTEHRLVSRILHQRFSCCTRPRRPVPKTRPILPEPSPLLIGSVANGWLSPLRSSILDMSGSLTLRRFS